MALTHPEPIPSQPTPVTARATATSSKERYFTAAKAAGCDKDQILRFWRAGLILQPRQLQFAAACRECDRRDGPIEIGLGGARGGGKSFALLAQVGADDCQRIPGLKCLLLRKVGKAVREHFEDLRLRVFPNIPHKYASNSATLTFPNGSRIIAGHFQAEKDIDSYLGLEYDVIAVEEATTLTAKKRKSISTCCRTSKPNWRPRQYSTTNPGGIGHAAYRARFILPLRAGKETDTRFIPATVEDNRFNNPEYVNVLDSLTGWELRAWRYGDWDIAAGQFFTTFRREVHVDPIAGLDDRKIVRWSASMDYGYAHYCAFYLIGEDRDGNVYFVDEVVRRHSLVPTLAEAFKGMIGRHRIWQGDHNRALQPNDLHKLVAGGDIFATESNGVSVAKQFRDLALLFTPAVDDRINGAAEMLRRLGDISRGIQPTMFIHPRCTCLAEQLPQMQHDPDRPEDVLKVDVDEDGNGGDDQYDAARYGIATRPSILHQRRIAGL